MAISSPAIAIDISQALQCLPDLKRGDLVSLPLLHNTLVNGRVTYTKRSASGVLRVAGSIENQPGASFSVVLADSTLSGRILLPEAHLAYTVEPGPAGQSLLKENALSSIICDPLPRADIQFSPAGASGESTATASRLPEEAPPIHSSRPSATAVLYLDFDGEVVTDPDWNGGNSITAAPSLLSNTQITDVWKRVAEDYAPFDIDITTDVTRYNNAPPGKRMRCIITPTSNWYNSGQAGGVAYLDSFARGDDDFTSTVPCWAFEQNYQDVSSTALIVSHELGHTLGLKHDGRISPADPYYGGHSNWGPIMGAPYYQNVIQWSKGEYASTNNTEDDLAIIAGAENGFGYIADDVGDTRATAAAATTTSTTLSANGLISTTSDIDFFSFTVPACSLTLTASSPSPSPNLDIRLEVQDSAGNILVSADPYELSASAEVGLSAGTYYIKIEGVGRGNPLSDGYSDYGSLGQYTITGTIGAPQAAPVITTHPATHTAYEGEYQTSFNVSASGMGTLRYQWTKDGVDLVASSRISSVQSSYLSITNPVATDAGTYRVRISNLGGSVTSNPAVLTISPPPPPTFSYSPAATASGLVGASTNFSAYASGIGTITYQWEKDGVALVNGNGISGANSTYLTIAPLALTHSGAYRLKATNVGGSTFTTTSVLTVSMPPLPVVSTNLADFNVIEGLSLSYWQAYFTASGNVTYQWYKNGQPIAGATSSYYSISSIQPSHAGKYILVATNATGSTSSREATLTVIPAAMPIITRQPASTRVYAENTLILSTFATGLPAPTYQWKLNGVNLPGNTSASLTIANIQTSQSGIYTVTATNIAGSVTSNPATVSVLSRTSGEALNVLPLSKSVGAARIAYSLAITANGPWTASSSARWISLSQTSGYLSKEIEITVAPNASNASRTATINVSGFTHTLTQAGANVPVREAWGMGITDNNQLGTKQLLNYFPRPVLTGIKAVSAGTYTSYFLKTDGTLLGMGSGSSGQLGTGNYNASFTPVQIATQVTAVSAFGNHMLFLKADGTLWGCGEEYSGELGSGSASYSGISTPRQIATGVASMSIGTSHSAFVKTDGSLWGVGSNNGGRLGLGTTLAVAYTPTQILSGGVKAVSCGNVHTLILKTDGTLWATGYNNVGQLGTGNYTNASTPQQVATGVASITAGVNASIYVTSGGDLRGMGQNSYYMFGSSSPINTPVLVASGVQSAALNEFRLLFIKTDGTLYGKGDNPDGALGDGSSATRSSPILVASLVSSAATSGSYSLFVSTDGTAYGMGSTLYGQLGTGPSNGQTRPIHLASNIEAVAACEAGSYLLGTDGSLFATTGTAGTKTTAYASSPTGWQKIASGVNQVAAGSIHVLVSKSGGAVYGAGNNSNYQMPGAPAATITPSFLNLGISARQIAAIADSTLIIKADDTVWASGDNSGRFGNGSLNDVQIFTQIGSNIASLSGGNSHVLYLKKDGTLLASGESYYGQSGPYVYGPPSYSTAVLTPNTLATGVIAAAAGGYHSLYLKSDNTLWGLGNNDQYQLGGTTGGAITTAIQMASDVKQFAGGGYFTLYTKSSDELWSLGNNNYGQLGRTTASYSSGTPGRVAANVVSVSAGSNHALFIASGDIRLDPPPGPTVTSFTPVALTPGTSITITGTNLANTSQVLFNGIETASFTINSATQISAIVPANSALSAGTVKLATFDGIATSTGTFTVAWAPTISTQPVNQSVTNGRDTTFATDASGNPATSYQWQVSTDNGATWTNIANGTGYSGATGEKLTVIGATSGMNGYRYRYSATNSLGSVTSNAFTLTVTPVQFPRPVSLAFDAAGSLYISDASAHTIQKLAGTEVSPFAGSAGLTGEINGTGEAARFNEPRGLAFNAGGFSVADTSNGLVRTITTAGSVASLAGASSHRTHQDGTGANGWFAGPRGVARDSSGNTFVTDSTSHTIRKITSSGVVTTIAGSPGLHGIADGIGSIARFNEPSDIAIDAAGDLYVADTANHTIRKITLTPAVSVSTIAGLPETPGDFDGTNYDAAFRSPAGLTVDSTGNIYVADTGNALIRKITPAGVVSTIAGMSGIEGMRDGTALNSWFRQPADIARSPDGTLYVADTGNAAIRKIATDGTVTTLNPTPVTTPSPGTDGGGSTPSTPAAPGGAGGGGGGGGAPSVWFLGVLTLLTAMRVHRCRCAKR
ncbi:MAG: immunoglobulin domain-containing protein [Nibricoccus sp.]